ARAVLARARVDAAVDPESRISIPYDEAVLLMLLGDRAQARERLQVYVALRPSMREIVDRDPLVRPLTAPDPTGAR
ncbi:MAG TPA: hypothetical protein VHG93_10295, partial [Longimicrobium sp.]|nr:hypothetical protein [Longimicrobium sp.]